MNRRARQLAVLVGSGIAISLAIWLLTPPGPIRQADVFLLAWFWPTIGWAIWWNGAVSERIVIGAGTALMFNMVLALGITYIPGPTPAWALTLGVLIASLVPLVLILVNAGSAGSSEGGSRRQTFLLSGLLLLAILLRLPNMGYKEFQGDEGVIMVRAADILTGDDAQLFNHQKGPVEILLPLLSWGIGGSINDYWARVPFTWAGILTVLAVYWLGRKWFGSQVGLLSGLLFAVGGFGIAFSRIVQYQSLVMLWTALALLMAGRYRAEGRQADLVMACSFLAGGTLAHYDALLVAPAVAWELVARLKADKRPRLAHWLFALVAAGFVLLLFYLPFVLNPNIGRTFDYLVSNRLGLSGGNTQLVAGIRDAWRMMTFYNSIWYVLGLLLATAVGVFTLVKRRTGFAAVLYFAVPAVFYLLLVRDPRTHVYTLFPGASVLAGVGAAYVWRSVKERFKQPGMALAAVVGILWLLLVVIYPILLFIDTSPERQRTWGENRPLPRLFPVTWDEPPIYGLFGFPHQGGWRALGASWPEGALPYGSNEEAEITNWYMAQAPRTHCEDARSFFLVANVQDAVPYDTTWLETELVERGQILVNDEPSMKIYGRDEETPGIVVEATGSDLWLEPVDIRQRQNQGQVPVGVTLGEQIRLLGYDLKTEEAHLGGQVELVLYWQAQEPIERNYQVFVHLSDGQLWAQHDGAPDCGIYPTTRWEPGQVIVDPHIVDLPSEPPLGSVAINVGMYDLLTEVRLPIEGHQNGLVEISELEIQPD